jgi:hypothetical protein
MSGAQWSAVRLGAVLHWEFLMVSITLGSRVFDNLTPATMWVPERRAGLYSIVAAAMPPVFWPLTGTGDVRMLYIGESGNMDQRGFANHHARTCWESAVRPGEYLAVATCLMPGSSTVYRTLVEEDLIRQLHPPCNIKGR